MLPVTGVNRPEQDKSPTPRNNYVQKKVRQNLVLNVHGYHFSESSFYILLLLFNFLCQFTLMSQHELCTDGSLDSSTQKFYVLWGMVTHW